jgi:hypothetical protein
LKIDLKKTSDILVSANNLLGKLSEEKIRWEAQEKSI